MLEVAEQRAGWVDQGWLWCRDALSGAERRRITEWAEEIEAWPDSPDRWLKYYEVRASDKCRVLHRVENFLPYHSDFMTFASQFTAQDSILSPLFGEPAVLFKDKINFKPPGAGGYAIHQDAGGYRGFGLFDFVSVMIPIDDSTDANGCLELASGHRIREELEVDERRQIHPSQLQGLAFVKVPARSGDMLIFDGLVPHLSRPNMTDKCRRAIFLTFNRASAGSFREQYFREKRAHLPPESWAFSDKAPPARK
jgi:hypothetical protein